MGKTRREADLEGTNQEFRFDHGESKMPTGHPSGHIKTVAFDIDLGVIVPRMVFKAV